MALKKRQSRRKLLVVNLKLISFPGITKDLKSLKIDAPEYDAKPEFYYVAINRQKCVISRS